jgi:manganese oxidase
MRRARPLSSSDCALSKHYIWCLPASQLLIRCEVNMILNNLRFSIFALLFGLFLIGPSLSLWQPAAAQTMGQEQAEERRQLDQMKGEMGDVKSNINGALDSLNELSKQVKAEANTSEIHLIAKEARIEIAPGHFANCLTYNGKIPGPTIRVTAGEPLRVVLHNQLKQATSLTFHGLILPQSVSGLPRKQGGLVGPGQVYAFQFTPKQSGTFWYHPQVNQALQKSSGMYGALIVEPRSDRRAYDRDFVIVLGQAAAGGTASAPVKGPGASETYYLMNGMTAATIKPIELHQGEHVHMRFINAGSALIPISLTGHKFEVVAINGSDALEPHVFRDTITVNPADRIDVEFSANNPGVWSLASELPEQVSNLGSFPGGIACVVRYLEANPEP